MLTTRRLLFCIVCTVPSNEAPSDDAFITPTRRRKLNAKRKVAKPKSVPNIDPSISQAWEEYEEGGVNPSRELDASSSDHSTRESLAHSANIEQDEEETVEIPTDPASADVVAMPKKHRSTRRLYMKKKKKKAREEADQGDDEAVSDEGAKSSDSEDDDHEDGVGEGVGVEGAEGKDVAKGTKKSGKRQKKASSAPTGEGSTLAPEKDSSLGKDIGSVAHNSNSAGNVEVGEGDVVIAMPSPVGLNTMSEKSGDESGTGGRTTEGESGQHSKKKKKSKRLDRFRLHRANTGTIGSRILWGGGGAISSYDEDSYGEGVELTPLELARIHAAARRSKAALTVPSIYDHRPRSVLEAALLPPPPDGDAAARLRSPDGTSMNLGLATGGMTTGDEVEMEELNLHTTHDAAAADFIAPIPTLVPKYPLEELIPFLTLLAKTFHSYGAPVNRTELNMREVAEVLGVVANFSVMPTQITITFGLPEGMDAVSRTFRCDQNIVECGRLYLVEKLIEQIRTRNVDLYQAREKLLQIRSMSPQFPRIVQVTAIALSSGSSAILFFGGSWTDFTIAFIMGIWVGICCWFAELSPAFGRVLEIISALVIAAVAVPVTYYSKGCFSAIVLSACVWLLPGLTLTLAIRELATGNMVAGTVRMFSAFMTALKLGFGIAFGSYIPFWIPRTGITTPCQATASPYWMLPTFFTTVVPFNILLDTSLWQWPGQLITSGVGFIIYFVFSTYVKLPGELVSVVAAFGVSLVGNGYALWSNTPGVVYIVSGILLVRIFLNSAAIILKPFCIQLTRFSPANSVHSLFLEEWVSEAPHPSLQRTVHLEHSLVLL